MAKVSYLGFTGMFLNYDFALFVFGNKKYFG